MILMERLVHQQRALEQWLSSRTLDDSALLQKFGCRRSEGLTATIQFHLSVMNFAVARLSIDPMDCNAQQLLLSGAGIEPFSWVDSSFFSSLWRGQHVEELVLWHDQGYGDAIQNLAWIEAVSQRVDRLRLFVRASLMRVVQERMSLPNNCQVEVMNPQCPPWQLGSAHLGLWFVPLKLGGWKPDQPALQRCSLSRRSELSTRPSPPGSAWCGWQVVIKLLSQSWRPVCEICLLFTCSTVFRSGNNAFKLSASVFSSSPIIPRMAPSAIWWTRGCSRLR